MAVDRALDPALLRTFVAVAQLRSFTRGAQRLGLSQPTASQHVRRLEECVGQVLVARDTRTVTLTDSGDAMLGFARTILAAQDQAISYFTGSAMRGRLRFGAADELARTELPQVLRSFRLGHPRIDLELTVTQSAALLRRLYAGHLDLVYVNQAPDSPGGRLVRRDRLVWVGLDGVPIEPSRAVPLVTYQAPSFSRDAAIRALEGDGRTWRITCNVRQMNGIHAALHAGMGIGLLAESRVPEGLVDLSGRFGLPAVGHVDTTLVANPRSAREPVEALTRAILRPPPAA
ncbi:LysR substrate-binding domain-containing protein [Georgenia sp. MJ173]|uniref:LysR substrate-binding domain-containing protein n=1 Tax=Georgenia sunbinii TaxID=3117728 RepID=UPI002F2666F7